jgi:diguanylate cyclase (GGDEF)-like protein/PAS domain S-box-containing protein
MDSSKDLGGRGHTLSAQGPEHGKADPTQTRKRRLLRTVLPLVIVILFQASLAGISLEVLSSVRAYVGAEGLWSKGQKDAIHFLTLYARTGNEEYFGRFQSAVAVPLADRAARYAMERQPPDLDAARVGFRGGGNHPDDIDGMIRLFRHLGDVPYMARAIANWRATDTLLDQLTALGGAVHGELFNNPDGLGRMEVLKNQIDHIDRRLGSQAMAFSQSLGEGSRSVKLLLTIANLLTAACLIALSAWHIRKIIDQRLKFERALEAEKQRAQVTLASLGEAVIRTDARGHLNYMNPAAELLTGCTAAGAQGKPLGSLFRMIDDVEGEVDLVEARLQANFSLDRLSLIRADSSHVAVSIIAAPLHADGKVAGAVLVFHDLTREHEFVARLAWQASHDALTGLPNRREFDSSLERTLSRLPGRHGGCSVMFIDLDQFKVVNDTCGHAAGDQLLKQTSELLQANLGPEDLLARLGGDEFGVLLRDSDGPSALHTAERLRRAVEELKFVWNQRSFCISASIGLASISEESTVEETLRAADVACYIAKEKGRNRVQVYLPSDAELAERLGEMSWIQRIRNGLDENRFCLFAQEIRALKTREADQSHIELLLRLRDENGDIVAPHSFMPAAERFGLMPLIDRWVVKKAFELLARRRGSKITTCAINISGTTFGDEGFVDYVRRQLREYQVRPELICFEITESSAIANIPNAKRLIKDLRQLGCHFSLDDFGTGMASFAYLKHLNVDYVKIDGSFVKEILNSDIDRVMVEMIVQVAKVAGKKCIAEFVESEEILDMLRDLGVDYAQGYAIGRPQPFEQVYPIVDLPLAVA